MVCYGDDGPCTLQELGGDLLVHLIVLDKQDANPGGVGGVGHLFAVPRLSGVLGGREDIHQAVVEHRRADRLQQVVVDADLRRLGANVLSSECGDTGNFRDVLQSTSALDD